MTDEKQDDGIELEAFKRDLLHDLSAARTALSAEYKAHDLTKSELTEALGLLRQLVDGVEVCADPFLGEKEPCGGCTLCYAQALLTRLEEPQ
jgi:hypothetical protein